MQEKLSIMIIQRILKIQSLRITVQHHLTSLVLLKSNLFGRIFNMHLTTIQDSYKRACLNIKTAPFTEVIISAIAKKKKKKKKNEICYFKFSESSEFNTYYSVNR